jgi:hypothetical protein
MRLQHPEKSTGKPFSTLRLRYKDGAIVIAIGRRWKMRSMYSSSQSLHLRPAAFLLSGMNLNELQGRLTTFDDFESELNQAGFDKRFVWIEPKYGADKFDITGPGNFTCGNSMHPLDDVVRMDFKLREKQRQVHRPLTEDEKPYRYRRER